MSATAFDFICNRLKYYVLSNRNKRDSQDSTWDTCRLQMHNSIHFFCAHRIYCTYGDSVLRDTNVLMHSALQYVQQLCNCFHFFEIFQAGCEGSCQGSTHQSLEVIFVGYDWKCLYVMYCIKSLFGFVVVGSKSL